jgi:hypothetical protein
MQRRPTPADAFLVPRFLLALLPFLVARLASPSLLSRFAPAASAFAASARPASVYMAVVCVDPYCARGLDSYASWGRAFLAAFPGSELQFFHRANVSLVPGRSVCVPGAWEQPLDAVLAQDFASARAFLARADLAWYVRTSYDAYCHVANLRALVGALELAADPLSDVVVRGEAFARATGEVDWVHGGAGWLMSRAAAAAFVAQEPRLRALRDARPPVGDDVLFGDFLRGAGLRAAAVRSGAFQGAPVREALYRRLERRFDLAALAVNCSPAGERFHPRARVRDLVFLHNGRTVNWAVKFGRRIVEEAGDALWIESSATEAWFCRL